MEPMEPPLDPPLTGTIVLTLPGHCAFWASNGSFVYWFENKMSLCQPFAFDDLATP